MATSTPNTSKSYTHDFERSRQERAQRLQDKLRNRGGLFVATPQRDSLFQCLIGQRTISPVKRPGPTSSYSSTPTPLPQTSIGKRKSRSDQDDFTQHSNPPRTNSKTSKSSNKPKKQPDASHADTKGKKVKRQASEVARKVASKKPSKKDSDEVRSNEAAEAVTVPSTSQVSKVRNKKTPSTSSLQKVKTKTISTVPDSLEAATGSSESFQPAQAVSHTTPRPARPKSRPRQGPPKEDVADLSKATKSSRKKSNPASSKKESVNMVPSQDESIPSKVSRRQGRPKSQPDLPSEQAQSTKPVVHGKRAAGKRKQVAEEAEPDDSPAPRKRRKQQKQEETPTSQDVEDLDHPGLSIQADRRPVAPKAWDASKPTKRNLDVENVGEHPKRRRQAEASVASPSAAEHKRFVEKPRLTARIPSIMPATPPSKRKTSRVPDTVLRKISKAETANIVEDDEPDELLI